MNIGITADQFRTLGDGPRVEVTDWLARHGLDIDTDLIQEVRLLNIKGDDAMALIACEGLRRIIDNDDPYPQVGRFPLPGNERRQYGFVEGEFVDLLNGCAVGDAEWSACWPDSDPAEDVLMDGWCGCGAPDIVTDAMARHLRTLPNTLHDADRVASSAVWAAATRLSDPWFAGDVGQVLWYTLAYRADELGFTTHGGSVGGAWLEPAGEAWLALHDANST